MTFSIVSKPVSGSNAASQIGHEPQYWHGYVNLSSIFWTSKVDAVSIKSLRQKLVFILEFNPRLPFVFITRDDASDVIDNAINLASPMINNGIVQHGAFFRVKCKTIPQYIGKPIATTAAKRVDNFLSRAVIRESRYEFHHRLMQL